MWSRQDGQNVCFCALRDSPRHSHYEQDPWWGGIPISAIGFREEPNTMPPGKSIDTYQGNKVAFAAGAVSLEG